MKKILSLLLSVILILSSLTLISSAYYYTNNDKKDGNFYYQVINDSSVAITEYDGEQEVLSVPATIAGKKVVAIGEKLCEYNNTLKEVIIENGIKSIEQDAFANCVNLEKVTIPDSVTKIDHYAFFGCNSLEIVLGGKNVVNCGTFVFHCTPFFNNSKNWENGQFYFGTCLIALDKSYSDTLKIKDGTTCVGASIFSDFTKLKSVYFPSSVRYFGSSHMGSKFWHCSNLEKIIVSKDNKYFSSVNGILFNKKQTILYRYPSAKSGKTYTVPKKVTEIAPGAFEGSKYLTTVNFDKDSTLKIDEYAFFNCKKIKSMTIPKNVRLNAWEPSMGTYWDGPAEGDYVEDFPYKKIKGFVLKGYASNKTARNYATNYLNTKLVTLCKNGKAHKTENAKAKKATYFSNGHSAYKRCKVCGEKIGYYRIKKLTLERPYLKVAGGKGTITVKYTPAKDSNGFFIRYIDENGNRVTKAFTGNKAKTIKLTGVAPGSYRVYARSTLTSGKNRAYSPWSFRKDVTVK